MSKTWKILVTAAISAWISACFYGAGWVVGADTVLFECRSVGATQFLGEVFSCEEPAKEML